MSDVVVTVPMGRWEEWIAEGDLPGSLNLGDEYVFSLAGAGNRPTIAPGERVYVVAHGKVRGYAPLVRVEGVVWSGHVGWGLVRAGGAIAVTLPEPVRGFQGWRYRWWKREDEVPFPDWRTP